MENKKISGGIAKDFNREALFFLSESEYILTKEQSKLFEDLILKLNTEGFKMPKNIQIDLDKIEVNSKRFYEELEKQLKNNT